MESIALSSLNEMYTDSEDEDAMATLREENRKKADTKSPAHDPKQGRTRLVSYLDDLVLSDDESHYLSVHRRASSEKKTVTTPVTPPTPVKQDPLPVFTDVDMPPEATGVCSLESQQKIENLLEKMKNKNFDMNQIIQERKSFRNPSIYEKLIQFCNINEFGTNYRPEIYNPLKWNESSFYDELSKQQKLDMDQREKDKRANNKRLQVEFVVGTAKKSSNGNPAVAEDEGKKRKSKWDQVGVYTSSSVVKPQAGMVNLTSSITGQKGTVISAFGSLPKKPKL